MADYFTQFSCMLHVGSVRNVETAGLIRDELEAELARQDGETLGFTMEACPETGNGAIWIYSDGFGDPEHVIRFVLSCAEAFSLAGRWGFCWSFSCSRPMLDGFGGGAHVLDLGTGATVADLDCSGFVQGQVEGATPAIIREAVS